MSRPSSGRSDFVLLLVSAGLLGAVLTTLWRESSVASPMTDAAPVGEAREVLSDVRRRGDGQLGWVDLAAGAPLYAGDAVFAGAASTATLSLEGGGTLTLEPNSLVVVRPLAPAHEASQPGPAVALMRGGVSSATGGTPVTLEVAGARVVVGARSGVTVRRDGDTAGVSVDEGSARVSNATGATALDRRQSTVVAPAGIGPSGTDAVALSTPRPGARLSPGHPVTFEWGGQPSATGFVFELSDVPTFERLTLSRTTQVPNATVEGLAPGAAWWRVRSSAGTSQPRSVVVAESPKPVVARPDSEAVIDTSRRDGAHFAWSALRSVAEYRVQVLDAAGTTALEETTRRPLLRLDRALAEGRYCLRVSGVGAQEHPWSDPRCFRVVNAPVLNAPRVLEPRREERPRGGFLLLDLVLSTAWAGDSSLVLRWEPVPGATEYLLEVSPDATFKTQAVRTKVKTPYYRWNTVLHQRHFWRVRAIDADGREGQVSPVSSIGAEVEPARLASPQDGASFPFERGLAVTLTWDVPAVVAKSEAEVSDEGSGGRTVVLAGKKGSAVFTVPAPGSYRWRVTGADILGKAVPPSATRNFTVGAPAVAGLRATVAGPFVTGGARVELKWKEGPFARYEVQLARDARFSREATTRAAEAPRASVTAPGPGLWYARVRGRSPDGPWSAAVRAEVGLVAPSALAAAVTGQSARLTWQSVPGAEAYEVRVDGREGLARVETSEVEVDGLRAGTLGWTVVAQGGGLSSAPADGPMLVVAAPALVAVASGPAAKATPTVGVQGPAKPAVLPGHFTASARVGLFSNLGRVSALAPGLELAWRPSQWGGRFGVSLSASTWGGEASFEGAPISTRASTRVVPLELRAHARWQTPVVDVSLAAGPALQVVRSELQVEGLPRHFTTDVLGGAVAAVAVERTLGPGAVYAEATSTWSAATRGAVVVNPSGLSVALGYRVFVW